MSLSCTLAYFLLNHTFLFGEQIDSVRDISLSNMADSSGNSNKRRLLRLKLTDGHSEITAVEYSHIPSIPDDIVPGTKVYIYFFCN